ncbi:MAG: 4-(cytidine 5'-diphospho)-2-C-methyl-D-erythritol kinase [Burkholderiaceae bacterium]|nr:4-(cytidine 5'-diphospho)-2-C-methyl-D-erythritol kinase [Burkholderiaceae bacterium]
MKALYDVPAPAKLNLFLHVTGRRPDGYHLLQSVFMLIDWHDVLHFELRAGGAITREDLGTPLPADDLTLRAARALQQAGGTSLGVHIAIDKQVPAQAGMGGGSSDAATCLLALNRLWRLGLPLSALEKIGLALGADVPFFLRGRSAWVEGIGEEITPIALPTARFVVVKPREGLDTAAIFRAEDLKRDTETAIISGFAANLEAGCANALTTFGRNDLQPVAQRLCPAVSQALEWLAAQGLKPRMTGSGSAVFALTPQARNLPAAPSGWQVRECGNLAVHPLWGWAASDDVSVGSQSLDGAGFRPV